MTSKVSSPWGAFLGLAWSGTENVWEDGSAWDYQNFGQGHICTLDVLMDIGPHISIFHR